MKRILIRLTAASLAFTLGIVSTAVRNLWPAVPATSSSVYGPWDEPIAPETNEVREILSPFDRVPPPSIPEYVDEAYSLTWIPSFGAPVRVDVWRCGLRAFMSAKSLDNLRTSSVGELRATARTLTDFEWREFTRLLDQASYWNVSSKVDEVFPEDGAVWFLDGFRNENHHWVQRFVPNAEFAELCKYLMRLSGLETAHSLYLPVVTR